MKQLSMLLGLVVKLKIKTPSGRVVGGLYCSSYKVLKTGEYPFILGDPHFKQLELFL